MAPRKVIIDTDCGVDDAFALLCGLTHKEQVDVVAVTCVNGNATLPNVLRNVSRVLDAVDSDIPYYSGAWQPLIGRHDLPSWPGHGKDGMGDTDIPVSETRPPVAGTPAANAIVNIVNAQPGEVSIIMLGPMTNLALALQLDANLAKNLDQVYFMGGTSGGKGNASTTAEFNFLCDPEAAHIVLDEIKTKAVMISWELTVAHGLKWSWYDKVIEQGKSKLAEFSKKITQPYVNLVRGDKTSMELGGFVLCDVLAVAVFIDPSIIESSEDRHACVELSGRFSRGHLAIDWYDRHAQDAEGLSGKTGSGGEGSLKDPARKNVVIVHEIKQDRLEAILETAIAYV